MLLYSVQVKIRQSESAEKISLTDAKQQKMNQQNVYA